MPLYTYRCSNCGFQFDYRHSINDKHITRCPECQKNALQRVYKPVGILFKGAGFYATDHHSTPRMGTGSNGKDEKKSETSTEKSEVKDS
ncbi:MAG: FmdB family zinc ribbon protein [Chloroflexota bacterium]